VFTAIRAVRSTSAGNVQLAPASPRIASAGEPPLRVVAVCDRGAGDPGDRVADELDPAAVPLDLRADAFVCGVERAQSWIEPSARDEADDVTKRTLTTRRPAVRRSLERRPRRQKRAMSGSL
jgi:hypothetical protein